MESTKADEAADSVETECEAGVSTEDTIQTVYTNLTPVTIQDESGLRQIYVPVEQADTLTSLADSISESTGNQQLPVSGIPGQLITITLPPGTTNATNQLQIADGTTLLSLQENNVISFPTSEETEQITTQEESGIKDDHHLSIGSDSEVKQNDKSSTHDEIGSELLGNFLNTQDSSCNITRGKQEEFGAKKPDDFTAYIRTLLTQSQEGVTDSSSQEETDEPIAKTTVTAQIQPAAKVLPQVFSNIEASLSSSLLDAIPGSKSAYLSNIEEECCVKLKANSDDTFSFLCSENQIVNLYDKLSVLLPSTKNPFRHKEQRHKGISCDLLRPMFSRSGREVKPKQYEIPVDDEPVQHDSDSEAKVLTSVKRKRGRPPKQVKVINDKPKRLIVDGKQQAAMKELKDNTKNKNCASSQEATAVKNTSVMKNQIEPEGPKVTLKEKLNVESHSETPTDIELDAGSSNAGLKVEEFVESTALSDLSDDGLNLDEDNMKLLMKLDVDKDTPSKLEGVTEEKKLKLPVMKPIKRSKGLAPKKKPKKDYEGLLPFKYFCNQCSFKSKRQSHYNRAAYAVT